MDLFPLGYMGVALGRMETNRRRAQRGSVLESQVRMPTMEDVITALLLCRGPVDDKNHS